MASSTLAASALLLSSVSASASEGTFRLINQTGEDSRCFAASVIMQDLNYTVLVSCRDIIYPGGADIFNYVVWANPATGKPPIRLGEIGLGKVEFKVKESFNTLFVTKERAEKPKTPSGNVVMRGNLEIISFLDSPSANSNKPSELATPTTTQSPTPRPTTSRNPLNWLKIGGAIAFVALFATFLVIFLITRR